MRLKSRVEALEGRGGGGFQQPVAWIIQQPDESREVAVLRHEAEFGPIAGGTIVWSVMSPDRTAACA